MFHCDWPDEHWQSTIMATIDIFCLYWWLSFIFLFYFIFKMKYLPSLYTVRNYKTFWETNPIAIVYALYGNLNYLIPGIEIVVNHSIYSFFVTTISEQHSFFYFSNPSYNGKAIMSWKHVLVYLWYHVDYLKTFFGNAIAM